jgi:hypothetical protein
MCSSQYLESGYTSLEHRHFLPSVRRHRPGSGSSARLPPETHPEAMTDQYKLQTRMCYMLNGTGRNKLVNTYMRPEEGSRGRGRWRGRSRG